MKAPVAFVPPVFFAIACAIAILLKAGPYILRAFQDNSSKSWPLVPGTCPAYDIRERRMNRKTRFLLSATYRYEVGATMLFGTYTEEFASHEGADHIGRSLLNGSLWVRHHPRKPEVSYLNPYRDSYAQTVSGPAE
jgi:hypothetical protein